ncbi:hypothetical protein [Paraburkholderia sp. 2C]
MKRSNYALIVATVFTWSLPGHAVTAASLTREQVRADLIAAELSGKFPQNKGNKRDPAMSYAAKKEAQKGETNPSGSSATDVVTTAPAAPALQARPRPSQC